MPDAIRILHLLPAAPDFQTQRLAAALQRDVGPAISIVVQTIGGGGTYRNPVSAVIALRTGGAFDVIHAWDARTLTAAALGGHAPILYSPMQPIGRRTIGWALATIGHRNLHIVCPTATQRRLCVERGIPLERCHLIRPGVEFARVR